MAEHGKTPAVRVGRGHWSAKCSCGWSADFKTEAKADAGWRDHVVDARYDEHMQRVRAAS